MTSALKTALICGAAPLALSTVVLFTWMITGRIWLERAWLWLICFGIVCLVVGGVALVRHVNSVQKQPPATKRWLYPTLAAALLFLNIPVGALYLLAAINIASRYTVEVLNLSDRTVDSLVLKGPGVDSVELGPISARGRASKHLHFTGDGKLAFSGRHQGQIHSGIIENSTSPDSGGSKQICITADGVWEIQPLAR